MWSKGSLIALALSMLTATTGQAQQPPRRDRSGDAVARLEREVSQLRRELRQLQMQSRNARPMARPGVAGRQFDFRAAPRGPQDRQAFRPRTGGQAPGQGFNRPGQPPHRKPGVGQNQKGQKHKAQKHKAQKHKAQKAKGGKVQKKQGAKKPAAELRGPGSRPESQRPGRPGERPNRPSVRRVVTE